MTSLPSLLIAAAVAEELTIINERISGAKHIHRGPIELRSGSIRGLDVATLLTGPGTVSTAGALAGVFAVQPPKAVVVTGCGGAFEGSGLTAGDIAVATGEIHGQLGVEDEKVPGRIHSLSFLPNRIMLDGTFTQKGYDALQNSALQKHFKLMKGLFPTVATVTSRAETAAAYGRRYGVIMENMEGFAAAALCKQYDIPMMELRAVSNMVGQRDRSTWKLDLAFEQAREAILTILEII